MHRIRTMEDAEALVGKDLGASNWVLIDQERINTFAESTNDFQWIHTDPERAAAEMPMGTTIAHGYLLLSLLPALIDDVVEFVGLERAINYGLNKVRFKTMVPCGARVRVAATLVSARKRAGALQFIQENRMEIEDQPRPALIAETIGMYFMKDI